MATLNINFAGFKAFPRRLKVVAIIVVVEFAILATGYLLLDDMMADRVTEVSGLRTTLQAMKHRDDQAKLDLNHYPELRQRYDQAMASGIAKPFDGRTLVAAAKDLGDRNHLTGVQFKLGPIDTGKALSTPTLVVENNEAEFKFSAVLDTEVRAFWRDLTAADARHYRVIAFELERQQELDDMTLAGFRHGTISPLLQGRIDLMWTGVRPNLQGGGGS